MDLLVGRDQAMRFSHGADLGLGALAGRSVSQLEAAYSAAVLTALPGS
jgi:hypothetical protein